MIGAVESSIIFVAIVYVVGLIFIIAELMCMASFNDKLHTAKGCGKKRNAMILIVIRVVLWPLYMALPRRVTNRQYFPFY